ncbi:MAG: sigma-54-dependent Fis family transcriptional regulator [Spirochaetaceae bacterium]|nr:MAG: sigma-54-dependent Fis family transcriptional regulator [Spirochaetaceae bacterium]
MNQKPNVVSPSILIVDDDLVASELYVTILGAYDMKNTLVCDDSRQVMDVLGGNQVSVLLLDLNMPYVSGQELLPEIISQFPEIPVIVLTGEDRVDTAVECMKIGAFDYMTKPVDENRLITAVNHALKIRELQDEVHILSTGDGLHKLKNPDAFAEIVSVSPQMKKLFRYMEAVAESPKAVLITGESGTGKELVARVIHRLSQKSGAFVPVNVSGLDDTMFSDTLFGHRRGAFTGADTNRPGLIEQAAGGTLFLDEIGDMEMGPQVKLLRLLQEREYYPLGVDLPQRSNARIIAATNADLNVRQREGRFRKDLYYRLMAHHVHLPPLRQRADDIPSLVDHFLDETAATLNKKRPTVPKELYTLLVNYHFPGNIRELQSMIYDAMSRHEGGILSLSVFRNYIAEQSDSSSAESAGFQLGAEQPLAWSGRFPTLKEVEEFLVAEALEKSSGNQSIAARMLGVAQSTLSRKLKNG